MKKVIIFVTLNLFLLISIGYSQVCCLYSNGQRCYSTCCLVGFMCQATGNYGYWKCNPYTGQWDNSNIYRDSSCTISCQATTTISATTCYDSDGMNYYNSGYVRDKYGKYYYDFCSGNYVYEYYCSGDNVYSASSYCPYGCSNGACKNVTTIPSQYCRVHARVFECHTNKQIGGALIGIDKYYQYSSYSSYTTFENVSSGWKTITASKADHTIDSKSFYCPPSGDVYVDLKICYLGISTTIPTTIPQCKFTKCEAPNSILPCMCGLISSDLPYCCSFKSLSTHNQASCIANCQQISTTITTTIPSQASCKGRCGTYDPRAPCQCDLSCKNYGDCCSDICTACPNMPWCGATTIFESCRGRCGTYTPGASCQCDAYCKNYGDCCQDFCQACSYMPGC